MAYVVSFYGPLLAQSGFEGLKESHLANGYMPGDPGQYRWPAI